MTGRAHGRSTTSRAFLRTLAAVTVAALLPAVSASAAQGPASMALVPASQLIFSDNFAGPAGSPPSSTWRHGLAQDHWSNDGLAHLDGAGHLEVYPNGFVRSDVQGNPDGFEIPYEPGHAYRAEARLKLPDTYRHHTSFWLRTATTTGWAEMDVVEGYGRYATRSCAQGAKYLKQNFYPFEDPLQRPWSNCITNKVADPSQDFHTYSVDFVYQDPSHNVPTGTAATRTVFRVDGVAVAGSTSPYAPIRGTEGFTAAEFLNLQNKLNNPTAVPTGAPVDQRMLVDWVRVYSLDDTHVHPPVIAPRENTFTDSTGVFNGTTDKPYVLTFEHSADLSSWTCTLDGSIFGCPNPAEVHLGILPFSGHTFSIQVNNAAGADTWSTSWTGGQPAPTLTRLATDIGNGTHSGGRYYVDYAIGNTPLTTWQCTVDGQVIACNPYHIDIGPVAYSGHEFRITVQNYGGAATDVITWTGGP
jgi:Glycosyl hydrolases family 16